jgi:septal ring factor EnvC (AmiA/AmiB activator)
MRVTLSGILVICAALSLEAQSRRDLEEQRKKTLEEISYVDNMIHQTEKQKTTGINDIKLLGNRIGMRERVISGYKDEIDLISERIEINELAIKLMEDDLTKIKREYGRTIINSYRNSKGNPQLAYLLSAKDFNQGYKRIRYLQQMARFRRNAIETINSLKREIEETRSRMMEDLENISDLKSREEDQKTILQREQERKRRMVTTLSSREKQLRRELEEKRRNAAKIETEINRLIEEERRRGAKSEMTPEMRLISNNFEENKGRLPWPVEKGIITEKFGPQKHAVLENVIEINPGVEITGSGKINARSIFNGQIVRIFAIPGENMSIIIRHGKYYSVYQNLVNIKVKQGEMVSTKQELGEVFYDSLNGGSSVLKFMIFIDKEKTDPEEWIVKK